MTTSLCYRNPDGNYLYLQLDYFDTPDETIADKVGPEYDADRVGLSSSPS